MVNHLLPVFQQFDQFIGLDPHPFGQLADGNGIADADNPLDRFGHGNFCFPLELFGGTFAPASPVHPLGFENLPSHRQFGGCFFFHLQLGGDIDDANLLLFTVTTKVFWGRFFGNLGLGGKLRDPLGTVFLDPPLPRRGNFPRGRAGREPPGPVF